MLVGHTGTTRKTSAVNLGKALLEDVSPAAVLPHPQSVEALHEDMAAMNGSPALLVYGEFGEFLSRTSKGSIYAPLRDAFTQLWDCKSFEQKRVRKEPLRIVDPRLSLLAGVAPSFLEAHTTQEDFSNGFLNRWAFFAGERTRFYSRPEGSPELRTWLLGELVRIQKESVHLCSGMTPQAEEYWRNWTTTVDEVVKSSDGLARDLLPRAQPLAEKAALLAAFESRRSAKPGWKIGLAELEFGRAVAEAHIISALWIGKALVQSRYERTRNSVLNVITNAQGAQLTLGEVMQRVKPSLPKKEAQMVLDSLLEERMIFAHARANGVAYSITAPPGAMGLLTLQVQGGIVPTVSLGEQIALPAIPAAAEQAHESATFTDPDVDVVMPTIMPS
jgi:hypothetical protein